MASPRQRAARWRYVQYAVLVAILLTVALVADWAQIQRAFWNWELVKEQFPRVLTIALKNTLIYTACGFAFGLALGLVLALMRLSSVGPYRWIATGIIELFRGLPALVVFIALSVGFRLRVDGPEEKFEAAPGEREPEGGRNGESGEQDDQVHGGVFLVNRRKSWQQ